jgi:hypothetical protein
MLNRAPSLGRLTLVLLCLAVLAGLLLLARCHYQAPSAAAASEVSKSKLMARLTMLNTSDCEWQVVITSVASGDQGTWKVPVAKSIVVELAGGDYAVEQTMLADGAAPDATRRFTMRLAAGQSYRWRLMTLLSGEAAAALPPENSRGQL